MYQQATHERVAAFAGALICLALLVAGCGATDAPTGTSASGSTPVTSDLTFVVQRGRVTRELEFTGQISPIEEVPLYFRATGYVRRVLVRSGDQVKTGELLAELEVESGVDSVGIQSPIDAAELDLAVAEATLTQAEEANTFAVAQAEMALELAQEQLARTEALWTTFSAATTTARVGLDEANDAVARAEVEYQGALDRPWEPDDVREAYSFALQQARWDLEAAQALYDQAIANQAAYQRDLKIAEIVVKQAEAELEQLKKGVDPVLVIEVQRAQELLDQLREGSQIIAPVDGEVISLALYPGRPVEPFRTVIVIADSSAIEVSADLPTDKLVDVTEGQGATVVLSTDPGHSWTGTIRRLPYPYGTGGTIEGTDGVESLTRIDNSTRISLAGDVSTLDLGDRVQVNVVLEEKHNVLWLPPDAIRTFQSSQFVIIEEAGRQRRVDVELGIEGQAQVEILTGLEEGQAVVAP
jgi:multidrug efflux pump subunit AcrA (membrane-fusion protein)